MSKYIIIDTKYGKVRNRAERVKSGIIPSICTAVDKNEFFRLQSIEIYGDTYDYSLIKYINAKTNVDIICIEHGVFSVTPNHHLSRKTGCPKCSKILSAIKRSNSNNEFISKSNIVHSHKYDYSKCFYNRQNDILTISCPVHGSFSQTAKDHLRGRGCPECGKINISKARAKDPTGWSLHGWINTSKTSIEFDSYKVYIIECNNENEKFIKIGRTFKSVKNRFRTSEMLPYKFNIIKEYVCNPHKAFNLESKLKRKFKEYKYMPNLKFNGMHECFSYEIINLISTNR